MTWRAAAVWIVASACAPRTGGVGGPPHAEGQVRRFDLVPRGHDDNCLALNPRMGWSYNQACRPGYEKALHPEDPAACSWVFLDDDRSRPDRPACNSFPMDPDLGTDPSTTMFVFTCSDSPLRFPGHLNWGKYYGYAVTYEGTLSWEGYSGEWPGDHDLNFMLTLDGERAPGEGWTWIKVEIDSKEVLQVASPWWRELVRRVHREPLTLDDYVGTTAAVVTGLLGIDAEHMSARDLSLELHPAYALALRAPCTDPICSPSTERWALLARERGNEGLCSHWQRRHVLPQVNGAHVFRLDWRTGMTGVSVRKSTFCNDGEGEPRIVVESDAKNEVLLVTVSVPPGGLVDGDLYLEWTGAAPAETASRPRGRPRHGPSEELEDPGVAQQRLERLRKDPEAFRAYSAIVDQLGSACRTIEPRVDSSRSLGPKRRYGACDAPAPPFDDACAAAQPTTSGPGGEGPVRPARRVAAPGGALRRRASRWWSRSVPRRPARARPRRGSARRRATGGDLASACVPSRPRDHRPAARVCHGRFRRARGRHRRCAGAAP